MACSEISLAGIFGLLGTVDHDKLLQLKHKLQALPSICQGTGLLRAMVLLTLGRDTEARCALDALRTDKAARCVARRWAGVDFLEEASEEEPDVAWTVARMYHLLAEEKLCSASLRDAAYRTAHRAFSADDPRLSELQAEAHDHCGWDIGDVGSFQGLCSRSGSLLLSPGLHSGARSSPQPIHGPSGWSRACTLRSIGSPASLASNLEISQSPTLPLLTQPRSPPGPSNLCDQPPVSPEPQPAPPGHREPEQVSWPPSLDSDPLQESLHSSALQLPGVGPDPSPAGLTDPSRPPESRSHYPVECTEESAIPSSLPTSTQTHSSLISMPTDQTPKDGVTPPLSIEDTALQQSKMCPPPPSTPEMSPPSTPQMSPPSAPQMSPPSAPPIFPPSVPQSSSPSGPQTSMPSPPGAAPPCQPPSASSSSDPPVPELELESLEQKFYNFVVLHARADEHVALRVRERLEALGVPDGATFCEDFQVPGRGHLSCLQDAIDHSAFTILLLTPNFDCRLSLHQVSQALLHSFRRQGWQDSVIPFQPLETPELSSDTARLLTSLVVLDEHSQIFDRKVRNTFKKQKLQVRKAHWTREQEARAFRERSQHLEGRRQQAAELHSAYSTYLQSYLAWQVQVQQLQVAFRTHMSLGMQMPPMGQVPLGVPPPLPTCPVSPQQPLATWPDSSPPPLPTWPNSPQPPLPTWPNSPQPPLPTGQDSLQPPLSPWLTGTAPPPPAFPPANPISPHPLSPQSPGLQPLIIHHAQMVQLGLNNHMWGQRGAQPSEDKTQEAE